MVSTALRRWVREREPTQSPSHSVDDWHTQLLRSVVVHFAHGLVLGLVAMREPGFATHRSRTRCTCCLTGPRRVPAQEILARWYEKPVDPKNPASREFVIGM
jgi:hypothetical protein